MSGYETINGTVYYNGTDLSDIDWSEVTGVEWFAIACLSLSTLLCLAITVLLVIKRDYPPLKAKQVPLQIVCGISVCLSQIGVAAEAQLFPQRGAFLLNGGCDVFNIWMVGVFGTMLFVDTVIFGMLRLHFIFNWQRMPSTLQQILIFFCLWLCPDINSAAGVDYPLCDLHPKALYATYVYYAALLLLFTYLAIALRNVPRKVFSEYETNRNFFIVFVIIYIVVICFIEFNLEYQPWGRSVLVLLFVVGVDLVFIGRICKPLYHSFVDPEDYKAIFLAQLNNTTEIKAAASKVDLNATTRGRKSKRWIGTLNAVSDSSSKGENEETKTAVAAENAPEPLSSNDIMLTETNPDPTRSNENLL